MFIIVVVVLVGPRFIFHWLPFPLFYFIICGSISFPFLVFLLFFLVFSPLLFFVPFSFSRLSVLYFPSFLYFNSFVFIPFHLFSVFFFFSFFFVFFFVLLFFPFCSLCSYYFCYFYFSVSFVPLFFSFSSLFLCPFSRRHLHPSSSSSVPASLSSFTHSLCFLHFLLHHSHLHTPATTSASHLPPPHTCVQFPWEYVKQVRDGGCQGSVVLVTISRGFGSHWGVSYPK